MVRNPDQRCTQGVTKLRHNMRGVSIVPADCIGEVGPSRRRKKNLGHLPRPAVKLGVNIFPGNCFAAVHIETRQPTLEFGLMRQGQPYVVSGEAVPKLTDQVEPFLWRQAADVERRHDPETLWPFRQRNHNLRRLVQTNIMIAAAG
jgi:hypothetical protein